MATTKSAGAAKRTVDIEGKRLGIKKFGGEYVKIGNIILRQRGTKFHPGNNVGLGKDHTIFAMADGFVYFKQMTGYKRKQKSVHVLSKEQYDIVTNKVEVKTEVKKEVASEKPAKKVAAKKTTVKKTTKAVAK